MDRLELVEAGLADVPAMAAMTEALIVEEGGGTPAAGDISAGDISADLTEHLTEHLTEQLAEQLAEHMAAGFRAVLFRLAGALAGYAMFLATPGSTFLNHFFIAPRHRRDGLGRAAFDRLRTDWFTEGQPVTLSVMDTNPDGIAFWRALGFRQTSINMELKP